MGASERSVRAPVASLAAGEMQLAGGTHHYLVRVRRLRVGDSFVAFDPATGTQATARIVSASADTLTVHMEALRASDGTSAAPLQRGLHLAAATRQVTLVQGLAKGDRMDAVVQDATELLATEIVIATCARSVVRVDDARAKKRRGRWERIAEEAARQCGRAAAPRIEGPIDFREALPLVDKSAARFMLYEKATRPLAPDLMCALDASVPIAFAVGPEGGFEAAEVEYAQALGWDVASIGPSILRTETVAAAVLGAVRVWSALSNLA